jgi:hypothetical protein
MKNYYNQSDTLYPKTWDAVFEGLRYLICSSLYAREDYTQDLIKKRFILSDITDFALRESSNVFNISNVEFPFTAYSIGEVEFQTNKQNYSALACQHYSNLVGAPVAAMPYIVNVPMISFFAKASDYVRAMNILQAMNSILILLNFLT